MEMREKGHRDRESERESEREVAINNRQIALERGVRERERERE